MDPLGGFESIGAEQMTVPNELQHELEPPDDSYAVRLAGPPKRTVVAHARPAVVAAHHETGAVLEGEPAGWRCGLRHLRERGLDDTKPELLAIGFIEALDLPEHGGENVDGTDVAIDQREDR